MCAVEELRGATLSTGRPQTAGHPANISPVRRSAASSPHPRPNRQREQERIAEESERDDRRHERDDGEHRTEAPFRMAGEPPKRLQQRAKALATHGIAEQRPSPDWVGWDWLPHVPPPPHRRRRGRDATAAGRTDIKTRPPLTKPRS